MILVFWIRCNHLLNCLFIAGFSCSDKHEAKPDGTIIKYVDSNSTKHWYECRSGTPKRFGCLSGVFVVSLQYCQEPGSPAPTAAGPDPSKCLKSIIC